MSKYKGTLPLHVQASDWRKKYENGWCLLKIKDEFCLAYLSHVSQESPYRLRFSTLEYGELQSSIENSDFVIKFVWPNSGYYQLNPEKVREITLKTESPLPNINGEHQAFYFTRKPVRVTKKVPSMESKNYSIVSALDPFIRYHKDIGNVALRDAFKGEQVSYKQALEKASNSLKANSFALSNSIALISVPFMVAKKTRLFLKYKNAVIANVNENNGQASPIDPKFAQETSDFNRDFNGYV